jgi:hypothetical protein
LWQFASLRLRGHGSAPRLSEIGWLLIAKGAQAWDERTYVTGARKIWVVLRAVAGLIRSVPARWFQPWSPAPLRAIWKASNVQ